MGKKDRNYSATLTIKPVFIRCIGQGAKFMVVIIALVLIFKTQLTTLVNDIFEKITSESAGI
ncbi:hypothetical protein DXC31_02925 [Mediterraneibacter gnavus]|uniref:Putative Flagellin Flp1-like domain-containing protein n=1 Tax=Mediterraneibacter gnavus TaxID=33038 RepID=A0A3E4VCU8_MEDGN|nr:hypothetical protein DXC31_02925 [Mediterraneibacter gnavus]